MKYLLRTRTLLSGVSMAMLVLFAAACATQNVTPEVAEEIPDGADRIVLDRQTTDQELTADAPAQAFYVDARQHLTNNGFQIETADEDARTLTTEGMMMDDSNLMLRMNLQVQSAPGGSRLFVRPEWRTADGDWQTASWTSGEAQDAFARAFEFMQGLSHTEILADEE